MDVTEHKELVAQVSEERLQSERDMSELDARVQNYQKMLKVPDPAAVASCAGLHV